jgi:PEP-CTERM motif
MKRLKLASMTRAIGALMLVAAGLPASAAPITFDFIAPVTAGAFAGEIGTGSISFDDAFDGTLTPANSDLTIEFTFLGQSFDQRFDQDAPDFPEVIVLGGVPVSINFLLVQGASGVDFNDPTIGAIALQGALLPGRTAALVASIDVEARDPGLLPEPSSFGLAGLALLGLGWRRLTPSSTTTDLIGPST